jgi:hypothetical protein
VRVAGADYPTRRRTTRPDGFTVPWWLVEQELTWSARLLYARVAYYPRDPEGRVFFRQASVARELGMNERTIRRALDDLEAAGLLVMDEQKGHERLTHQPHRYYVNVPAGDAETVHPGPDKMSTPDQAGCPVVIEGVDQGEQHQGNPTSGSLTAPTSTPSAGIISRVFNAWAATQPRPHACRLTDKRRRLIRARLADGYSEADLVAAVQGWQHSPWHRGENRDGTVYSGLELLLRDGAKVEQFRDLTNGDAPRGRGPVNDRARRQEALLAQALAGPSQAMLPETTTPQEIP